MKTWSKYLHRLSLAAIMCGIASFTSYAQKTEVEQLEENLQIAETVKVYGGGNLQAAYSIDNYPAKATFAPVYIGPSTKKVNPLSKLIFDFDAKLGFKKTTYLDGKEILLNTELGLDKAGKAKIKKLHAKFENWVIGLHTSNFASPELVPDMLGGSPNAAVSNTAIQVSFMQKINTAFSYSIGLQESSKWDMYPGIPNEEKKAEQADQPNNGLPALAGNLVYNLPNKLGTIKLTGIFSYLSYYNKAKNDTFGAAAFGANLGTQFNFNAEQTKILVSGVYGQGIGNYIGDLSLLEKEQKTAYVQVTDSKVKTVDAWGGYLAIEHHWNSKLRSVASGGYLATIEDTVNRNDDKFYKNGYYAAANLTYHPTKQFHFGLEYLLGGRTNLDKKVNKDNMSHCIQTVAAFKF